MHGAGMFACRRPKEADLAIAAAKLTSKGQITLPNAVRDGLDLHEGDRVVFPTEVVHVALMRTSDFLDLAGTIPVPAWRRGARWDEAQHRAHGACERCPLSDAAAGDRRVRGRSSRLR